MARKTFKIKSNLVEALDDTVQAAHNNAGDLHVEIIPLRKIELDPNNPRDLILSLQEAKEGVMDGDPLLERKSKERESLLTLSNSIKGQGVINPILVYKHGENYRLIAGERRTLSCLSINKQDIPARVLTNKPSNLKISLLQWIENIEREDLSLWERLSNVERVIQYYLEEKQIKQSDLTAQAIANLLNCSERHGGDYLYIINGPDSVKAHIKENSISSIKKAALICRSDHDFHTQMIKACLSGATLQELKMITKQAKPKSPMKKGRPSTKIHLGSISKPDIAKVLINSVLEHKQFSHLQTEIGVIDWNDNKTISKTFKKLLQLIEKV
jgi:ParB family chromosome partitioning protein